MPLQALLFVAENHHEPNSESFTRRATLDAILGFPSLTNRSGKPLKTVHAVVKSFLHGVPNLWGDWCMVKVKQGATDAF